MSHLSQVPNKAIFSAKTSMLWNKKESSKWVIVRDLNDCDGKLPTPGRKGHGLQRKTFKPDGFFELFFYKKNCSLSRCRMVCCSYQSDRRISVCISYQSDFCVRVCIPHQSDCRIRVCITHTAFGCFAPITAFRVCILDQSYHSIWISCTNHNI